MSLLHNGPRPARYVKLRLAGSKRYPAYQLHVPADLARVIPKDAVFEASFTTDGILYRFVSDVGAESDLEKPEWAP